MNASQIKRAIESEFNGAEPSGRVWQRVRAQLPVRHWGHSRLVAGVAALGIVMMSSVGLAYTEPGQNVLDWVFQRFGIHLVDRTELGLPPLAPEEMPRAVTMEEVLAAIPSGMKLPTYLPAMEEPSLSLQVWTSGALVNWSANGSRLGVMYHANEFGQGSQTGTNGEAREIQEVMVGESPALAFQDDSGWRLDWAMDGHQYTVLTNLSLQEAIAVAESIR